MKLDRESNLVKWAYLPDEENTIPEIVSLCQLFWRCVLVTPLFIVFLWFLAGMIAGFVVWMPVWQLTGSHLLTFVSGAIGGPAVIGIGILIERALKAWGKSHPGKPKPEPRPLRKVPGFRWLASQRYKAFKSKVCPLIEIES